MAKPDFNEQRAQKTAGLWKAQKQQRDWQRRNVGGKSSHVPLGRWVTPRDFATPEFESQKERQSQKRYEWFRAVGGALAVALLIDYARNPQGFVRNSLQQVTSGQYSPSHPGQKTDGMEPTIHNPQPSVVPIAQPEPRDGGKGLEYEILKDNTSRLYVSFGQELYQLEFMKSVPQGYTIIRDLAERGIGNLKMNENNPLVQLTIALNRNAGLWDGQLYWGKPGIFLGKKVDIPPPQITRAGEKDISDYLVR